jgi:hypothetical protein
MSDLAQRIQTLLADRQQHANAIAAIDQVLKRVGTARLINPLQCPRQPSVNHDGRGGEDHRQSQEKEFDLSETHRFLCLPSRPPASPLEAQYARRLA